MKLARRITGAVALASYLVMGALFYFVIIPGANGYFPPDFRLGGYAAQDVVPFVGALTDAARDTYVMVLSAWDRVFIVAFAAWLALMGWRGGPLRFFVAGLAVLYAVIDLAEDAAIYNFVVVLILDPVAVGAASSLTMAKFAALYLTVLVLIWHLRREASE